MDRYKCAHTDRHITGNCTPPSIILASLRASSYVWRSKKKAYVQLYKNMKHGFHQLCPSALPTRCLFISLHLFVSALLSSHQFPTSHWLLPVNVVSHPSYDFPMHVMYMSIAYLSQGVCLRLKICNFPLLMQTKYLGIQFVVDTDFPSFLQIWMSNCGSDFVYLSLHSLTGLH